MPKIPKIPTTSKGLNVNPNMLTTLEALQLRRQLAKDLENQAYICKLSEEGEYMSVYYLWYLDYVEIALTGFKDWSVAHYNPFKGLKIYKATTNWSVIKLLRKLLKGAK